MSILDRAKAHFDKQGITEIVVPEWADEKGEATVIYSKPLTLAEKKKLIKFAKEDDIEFVARLIIMKALDKTGEPVFDISDRISLLNSVDPNILSRIAGKMTEAKSVEDFEGN
jgi:hypothetical protein